MGRNRFGWLGLFSLVCLVAAGVLTVLQMIAFSQANDRLPSGVSLGSVPVGGLTEVQAREQLLAVYNSDIELRYGSDSIVLKPASINFRVNAGAMLPQASALRGQSNFWVGLGDYMWLRPASAADVPLSLTYSQESLRRFLEDVAARYDRPGTPPRADPLTLGFIPGEPGQALNVDSALDVIDRALRSPYPEDRVVNLPLVEQTRVAPSYETLRELLIENAGLFQFEGLISLYLSDLDTGDELTLTIGPTGTITGPVAFSGMSTIKLPVMVTYYVQQDEVPSQEDRLRLQRMLDQSENFETDALLRQLGDGDGFEGTRQVVRTMQRLGLVDTYISGLLTELGAVLAPLETPANARTDIQTNPDPFNQTTARDMGQLTVMIHQCAENRGPLLLAFEGRVTPEECQDMITFMSNNLVGPIFVSGGSPGAVVAHKHGWDALPLTNAADAALVYTPGGNYALTIFIHTPTEMLFDTANRVIISMARAVHNYYNGEPR
jgi:hypothetical protein